jgi:uncharacterized protein (TIGR02271 family)
MTVDRETAIQWRGQTAVDEQGQKIGKVEEIYFDEASGKPEWAVVHSGLLGTSRQFVPLSGADAIEDGIRLPISKQLVKEAPGVEADAELSPDEEARLFEHYGVPYDGSATVTAEGAPASGRDEAGGPGRDVSGPNTDEAMTRSEEELRVGKARREAGRARLRKYVVTENVTRTVPVQREEVRVEREPITDGNIDQASAGPAISEEEHEVVLDEEEVVTEKRAVPKERVRLDKETVTEDQVVSEGLRKEQIDVEGDR